MSAEAPPRLPAPLYLTGTGPETPMGGDGDLAATAELLGRPLRPWGHLVADTGLARVDDHWRFPMVVLSVPRQAGKTTLAATVAIDRCLRFPGAQVWYTAQSRTDAAQRLADMAHLLEASVLRPWGRRDPPRGIHGGTWDYRVTMGVGNEAVTFPNGSALRVFAPREDSLHGSVTDLVIIDEARFFPASLGAGLMAAALPTQVTRDGQVWITSTAGGPESTWLAELMEQGRGLVDDPDTQVCYAEWGIGDDVMEGDLLEAVWDAHPAAGLPGGPRWEAVKFAAETMPAWQLAHEYGNRWRSAEASRLVPAVWWESTVTDGGPQGDVCFAVDVSPERSAAAVLACGGGVVEVVAVRPGVGWAAQEVLRLVERWDPPVVAVDPGGPAVTVAETLRPQLEGRLVELKTRDVVAACGGFYDALRAGSVAHRPDPDLDGAVPEASRRSAGGSWVFSRANGGHVLVAACLAHWADRQTSLAPSGEGWFVS